MDKFNQWINTPIITLRGERIREGVILIVLTALISNMGKFV